MGKRHKTKSEGDALSATAEAKNEAAKSTGRPLILSEDAPINPSLASLFEKSVCFLMHRPYELAAPVISSSDGLD
jgi:hypothetical protein